MFDDDGEIIPPEDGGGQLENFGEFPCGEAVIGVVGDKKLELAMSGATGGAAAVDEVFLHAANFSDVKVGGHDVSVRENNMEEGVGMGVKRGDESGGVEHDV